MSKRFNGRKMSHGSAIRIRQHCPICKSAMIRFLGVLRCTELSSGKRNQVRVVKHGSMRTIGKRMVQAC